MDENAPNAQTETRAVSRKFFANNRSAITATLLLVLILPVTLLAVTQQTRLASKANQPVTPTTPVNPTIPVTAPTSPTSIPSIISTPTAKPTIQPTPQTSPTQSASPTPTALPSPTPVPSQTRITIYAAGTVALGKYPNINLNINNTRVRQWTNVSGDPANRVFVKLDYTHPNQILSGSKIQVQFTNDRYIPGVADRNLFVDKILVNDTTYETENPTVFGKGVWNSGRCRSGNYQSEKLNCNGYFEYIIK